MLLSGEMNTKSGPSFTLNIHYQPNAHLDDGKEIYTLFLGTFLKLIFYGKSSIKTYIILNQLSY